jgi:hypothetical protein
MATLLGRSRPWVLAWAQFLAHAAWAVKRAGPTRKFPPDLHLLETIAIQGQELVIARAGG